MQFGGGGISYTPNQTPPTVIPPVVFPVTGANNGLRMNGTVVQLGGPLPTGEVLIEQDSFVTIQAAIPNQRFGIIYDVDPQNQFLITENAGHLIIALASSDGVQFSAGISIDPNDVLIGVVDLVSGNNPRISFSALNNNVDILAGNGLKITGDTVLMHTGTALANGAAANVGTLNNAPAAGNPTKWISIDDNGTIRRIPAW
jgi:hypothetical protein